MSPLSRRAFVLGTGALSFSALATRAFAQAPPAGPELLRELELRRAENQLLHRKVDLGGLRLFRDGKLVNGEPPPVARLLILHLWSVECRPCIEEFPILRRITDSLRDLPQVTVALVTETTDLMRVQQFLDEHRGDIPRAPHYLNSDDRLRRSLQNRAQPTTLFLDALGVVRQAFLGSLKLRRSEFADGISRLARSL